MKRQLSLVLALVMILGSFSAVFAAEATVEADAAAFLAKNGVLSGYAGSGDLGLEDNLLRQDTLVLVARLLGEYDEAKAHEGEVTYEDVKDPTYVPLAAWAKENNTFVGHSDAKFGFGENLTAQEYAKVLLVALDYTVGPNGDKDVNWNNVLTKAKDLGLLADVKVENATEITRGQMAVMTFNALETNLKGSDKTLADKLGIEMPAAKELTAEVNDTENLKEVVLELSNAKLADAEKLEDVNNYRVDKFKVASVTVDGDNVILLLDKALVKNRTYELVVRGLDRAIDKTYKFKADDNASPEVVNVEVLGEYGIKVTLSEPVDNPQERDFLVDGKNVAMNLETYGRDIILTPYYNSSFSAKAETLTIKGLQDYAGYRSALVDSEIEIVKDDVAPEVTDVTVDGKVVTVTFDKDIYKNSVGGYENARDEGNISYRSGRQDIFAEANPVKVATNKVEYTFGEKLPRRTEVTIVGVQNHSKVTMEKTTMEAREVKNNLEPVIVDVDVSTDFYEAGTPGNTSYGAIGSLKRGYADITIEFDKDIDEDSFDVDNFELYTEKVLKRYEAEGVVISLVAYDEDKANTVVVRIDGLVQNQARKYDYILEVKKFEDESGNRMDTDYVEFQLTETRVLEIEHSNTRYNVNREELEVEITLTRSVDRRRAEDATNYLFRKAGSNKVYDLNDIDSEIIVDGNGKRVTLILKGVKSNDYSSLEVLETLRDKDNNRLSGNRFIDLTDRSVDVPATTSGAIGL